jgi:quercetin dioxygenase-like cupin family protein
MVAHEGVELEAAQPAPAIVLGLGHMRTVTEHAVPSASVIEGVLAAEVVLPCRDLTATLNFFTERLAFRVDAIAPADNPSMAVISAHGVRLRLVRDDAELPLTIVLRGDALELGEDDRVAPNGTRIELVPVTAPLTAPPLRPALTVSRPGTATTAGRAGMRYRELIPGRLGGRFVASLIELPDGGPVPDYVHHHDVWFQMIHCVHGWVEVVYEDQGPPFWLTAGECVLQPPGIRHRVLASSAGAAVVEVSSPAEHVTLVDHQLGLPTPTTRPERDFGGQRFVRSRVAGASWIPWRLEGFECRDSGIAAATDGLAASCVVRPCGPVTASPWAHQAEIVFWFVVEGGLTMGLDDDRTEQLGPTDAVTIPAGTAYRISAATADLELLEVTLPV